MTDRLYIKITPDMTDEDLDILAQELYARVMGDEIDEVEADETDEAEDRDDGPA